MDPRDFTRFYIAINGETLGIKFLPNKTFRYVQLDCGAIPCVDQFPPDFSYMESLPVGDLELLEVPYSLLEQERCHPVSPSNQRGKDHEYVVTRIENDGQTLNGDPAFMLVDSLEQAMCFADTYLHETHATIANKPVTTSEHRDSLPSDMFYDKDQYDLVFNADFDDIPDDYNRSELPKRLANIGLKIGSYWGELSPFLLTEDKTDDPVFVRDGKLWFGVGLKGQIIPDSNPEARYECNPNKSGLTNAQIIETYNPDKCVPTGSVYMLAPYFKYGFVEINFSKMPTPKSGLSFWIQLEPPYDSANGTWHADHLFAAPKTGGTWPYQFGTNRDWPDLPQSYLPYRHPYFPDDDGDLRRFKMETHARGSEVQLMEMLHNKIGEDPFFWTVNHYGYTYNTSGNARWYYTVHTRYYKSFVYGIEWSPQGYIIWHKANGGNWRKVSTSNFKAKGWRGPSHQCFTQTLGSPRSITLHRGDPEERKTNGLIQCGINHVAHSIFFSPLTNKNDIWKQYMCVRYYGISGAGDIPEVCKEFYNSSEENRNEFQRDQYGLSGVKPEDLFMIYDSIRIYQPKNKYSDVPKLHQ